MTSPVICILGGDLRQLTVAKEFSVSGFRTFLCGFDKTKDVPDTVVIENDYKQGIRSSDYIILPLPYTKDGKNISSPFSSNLIPIDEIASIGKDKIFFGGMLGNLTLGKASFDYYENEELKILNAIPTAEGALSIALNESTETIHGCKTAVIGFGRIGKILGNMLHKLNSDVAIMYRSNKDDAWCSAFGLSGHNIRDIKKILKDRKIIFNTVPHILLTKEILSSLRKDVIIIDLASSPGGVDLEEGKKQGLNIIKALSLPGKLSPVTAGKAIKKCISNIIYDNNLLEVN
jgi:dipicolinate synthase subunit A